MPRIGALAFKQVMAGVAEHFQLSDEQVLSTSLPRSVLFYLASRVTGLSFPQIGRAAGGVSSTNVIARRMLVTRMMEDRPDFAEEIEQLERRLLK